jgi:hypothetical protein
VNIRPAYRADRFIGFALHTGREFVGKAHGSYKHAALALAAVARAKRTTRIARAVAA